MDYRMAKNNDINLDGYDYVIVGTGLAGTILARKLAEEQHKRVLILERRNHIGGNAYDYVDEYGIRVQKYGPHIFHTNSDKVFALIQKYCKTKPYRTKCEAVIEGISTPSPFNFKTIDQFYTLKEAAELKALLSEYYYGRKEVTIVEMMKAENDVIKHYADFLFEKDYRPYTAKQWNLQPMEINPSVLKRVPIVLSYRDTYFEDKYEFLPEDGFEILFLRLLSHPNITLKLNEDALTHITIDLAHNKLLFDGKCVNLIYTGAIDELFEYRYGMLPYRSLHFEFKSYEMKSFQNVAIVAYPQASGYTRITEYTKIEEKENDWTSVAYEYPLPYDKSAKIGNEPYYPVLTRQSEDIYKQYQEYAKRFKNLTLCGRLADFKYYNMDQVILRALEAYQIMEEK